MTRKITVVFDGQGLKPAGRLDLETNKQYLVTIEDLPEAATPANAWSALEFLTGSVEAPQDWASEHDHYLYGTPKRES